MGDEYGVECGRNDGGRGGEAFESGAAGMIGRAGWLAWSLRALCLALATGTLILALLNGRTPSEILIDEGIVAVATLAVGAGRQQIKWFAFASVLTSAFALTGQEPQLAVVVASTLAIAALFGPLRRRVRGFIDTHFYRNEYDAARTLEAFSGRSREETDLGTLAGDLVGVVRSTVHASLWLRESGERDDSAGARR